MKIKEVSKKIITHPTALIFVAIAAVIMPIFSSINEEVFLTIETVLVSLAVGLIIYGKKLLAPIVIVLAIGLFYGFFGAKITYPGPADGCRDVDVASQVERVGQNSRFLVKGADFRAVIETNLIELFGYGDRLNICFETGQVKELAQKDQNYLMSKYRSDLVYLNPKIKVVSIGRGFFRSAIDEGGSFRNRLNRLFPGDKGVLAGSLWLGGSQNFSAELKGQLKASGTTHIVAVSGYNVSILTITVFGLLRGGVSRRFAFIATILMLVVFCVMTGASSSVVRASIMGGLYLLEKAVGRKSPPMHAIALAALLMLLVNPFTIYDVGFQLSFAAISGLVLLGEPLKYFVNKISNTTLKALAGAGIETVSAQIFALPILIFSFGTVSIIAPIVNALILPVVPTTMFATLAVYFVSLIGMSLGLFCAAFVDLLLSYILGLIKIFSGLSFSVFNFTASAVWVVLLYVLVVCATVWFRGYIKEVKKKWETTQSS